MDFTDNLNERINTVSDFLFIKDYSRLKPDPLTFLETNLIFTILFIKNKYFLAIIEVCTKIKSIKRKSIKHSQKN